MPATETLWAFPFARSGHGSHTWVSRMVSRRAARAAGGAAGAGAAGRGGVELLRASQPAGRALRLATSQNKHSNFQRTIHALAAKVRPQPRITHQEELQPVLHKQCLLALPTAQLFLAGLFPAARSELVVVQLSIRCKDGAVAPIRAGKNPHR